MKWLRSTLLLDVSFDVAAETNTNFSPPFVLFPQEDIPRQLYYICLYVVHITGAYVLKWVKMIPYLLRRTYS